jgi:tetratricopeptide (TPR) repeat protein
MEGLGLAAFYGGDMTQAQDWYEKALSARIAQSGESHPKVSESLTALGSIAYMEGDSKRAEEYWLRSLSVDRRILGPRHPDLAVTMNNLGRLRVERREFERAIPILDEAMSLYEAEQSETHEGRVFAEANLALAHMGLRNSSAAEPLFQRALRTAVATRHRLEGPILTDLSDLECRTGRWEAGLARLGQARSIVAARYPEEEWRVAHVDSVRAGCLAGLNRAADAEALIVTSTPVLLERWPADTCYGHDAVERATRVYRMTGNSAKLTELGRMPDRP